MPWYDISISAEVENEDVLKHLMERIELIVCDGYDSDDDDAYNHHYCRRQWVASYKPSPEVDEDADAESGPVPA